MSKKARTFYVDSKDADVSLWVKNQHNLSASLRRVIKDTVARVGTDDYGDAIANRLNELETGKPMKKPEKKVPASSTINVDLLGLGDNNEN